METIKTTYNTISQHHPVLARAFRYIISGGSATFADLLLLYIFTSFFHMWYLFSAILAFVLAFFVSFFLQKYWTFEDHSKEGIHGQMATYLLIALINLGINTLLMYFCVQYFYLHYIVAQFIVAGLIALVSFFVYRRFVFHNEK